MPQSLDNLQGALYAPDEADNPGEIPKRWCWEVPVAYDEEGMHAGDEARLVFEHDTFYGLMWRAISSLQSIGFRGNAYVSSVCWRITYAELHITDEICTWDTAPDALDELRQFGAIGDEI